MRDDPFTMDSVLCDEDGIVRSGAMHHGTDYPCTGHAHFAGEHIRCIGPAHPDGLPSELYRALQDPFISLPGDAEVYRLLGDRVPRAAKEHEEGERDA